MADYISFSSSATSVTKKTTSEFRTKVAQMKAWRPAQPPSNRDRLELYALHKQVVSSDIPLSLTTPVSMSSLSLSEKAKMNAWRSKKGIPREQAMSLYIQECDRQLRVYGNSISTVKKSSLPSPGPGHRTPNNTPAGNKNRNSDQHNSSVDPNDPPDSNTNDGSSGGTGVTGNNVGNGGNGGTNGGNGVLLTPRGLAAVPLLCAAASESRSAYLARLAKTPLHQGWWSKQEPLCADPGTLFAFPETFVLYIASTVEWLSLRILDNSSGSSNVEEQNRQRGQISLFSPSIFQSFLWPFHNVLLAIWIVIIFLSTILNTAFLSLRTIIFGSAQPRHAHPSHLHHPNIYSYQMSLPILFSKEIVPASNAAISLCDNHQTVSIRITGLLFMPYVSICQMSYSIAGSNDVNSNYNIGNGGMGIWVGAVLYCSCLGFTWWYWALIVPWFAFAGVMVSLSCGWCFALIEMAGISQEA